MTHHHELPRCERSNDEIFFLERSTRTSAGWVQPEYPASVEFAMPWWSEKVGSGQDHTWISVVAGSAEVARVMVEPRIGFGKFFSVDTDQSIMEVVFLEVATSWRRLKLGTRILAELEKRYPNELLAAVSEDSHSDAFWAAVKWRRHEHAVLSNLRAVYVAPARR